MSIKPTKRTDAQQREWEREQAELREWAVRDGDHPYYDTLDEKYEYDVPVGRGWRGRRG